MLAVEAAGKADAEARAAAAALGKADADARNLQLQQEVAAAGEVLWQLNADAHNVFSFLIPFCWFLFS